MNEVTHLKKSTCTQCRMIRRIALWQDFTVENKQYMNEKTSEKITIKLCIKCLANSFMPIFSYLSPPEQRNVINSLAGRGNCE